MPNGKPKTPPPFPTNGATPGLNPKATESQTREKQLMDLQPEFTGSASAGIIDPTKSYSATSGNAPPTEIRRKYRMVDIVNERGVSSYGKIYEDEEGNPLGSYKVDNLSYMTPEQIAQFMQAHGADPSFAQVEGVDPNEYIGPRGRHQGIPSPAPPKTAPTLTDPLLMAKRQLSQPGDLRRRASELLGIPIGLDTPDEVVMNLLRFYTQQRGLTQQPAAPGISNMDAIDQLLKIAEGTGIQSFAAGGRVSRPTVALVGENGPELAMLQAGDLILPLPKKQSKKVEKMPGIPKMQLGGGIPGTAERREMFTGLVAPQGLGTRVQGPIAGAIDPRGFDPEQGGIGPAGRNRLKEIESAIGRAAQSVLFPGGLGSRAASVPLGMPMPGGIGADPNQMLRTAEGRALDFPDVSPTGPFGTSVAPLPDIMEGFFPEGLGSRARQIGMPMPGAVGADPRQFLQYSGGQALMPDVQQLLSGLVNYPSPTGPSPMPGSVGADPNQPRARVPEDIRFEQISGVPENRTNYAQNLMRGLTGAIGSGLGAVGGLFGDAPGRNKRLYDEYIKDQMTNPNQMSFEQFVLNRPVDIGDGQTMPLSQFQSLQQERGNTDFDPFETARTYQEAAASSPEFMRGMAIGVDNPLYNLGVIPGGRVSGMTAAADEADLMARAAAAQMPDPSLTRVAPAVPPSVETGVPPTSTATPKTAKENANITVVGKELGIDAAGVNTVRSTGDNFGFDIVEILAAARSPEGVTPDMYASLVSGLGDSEARMNVAGRRVEEIQSVINAIIPAKYDPRLDEQLAAAQLEQLEATREFETLDELNTKVKDLDQRTFDEKKIAQTRANQEADAELKRMNELEDAERERQQLISDDLRDRERELQDLEDERLREDQMQAERLQLGRAATREQQQYQQQQQQDMANSIRVLFKSLGIDLPEGSLAGISPEMMPQVLQMLFSMQRQQYAPPTIARFGFA